MDKDERWLMEDVGCSIKSRYPLTLFVTQTKTSTTRLELNKNLFSLV